jgi:hypothetical protein
MGLFKRSKNTNKPIIRQILDLIPGYILQRAVTRYNSDKYCSRYLTYDELVALSFGQLNKCQTLSDISTGLGVSETYIQDLGLKQSPARSTMSDGNRQRPWQVYEYLYYALLKHYGGVLRKAHKSHMIKELEGMDIKLIDSSTISLCLRLFDWAKFRTAKGGIKIHTCWDAALQIPDFINITEAKVHDSQGFENNVFPANTIIVEDKGYFDFKVMKKRADAKNIFVTRIKDNTTYESVVELDLPTDKDHHILKDEVILLTGTASRKIGFHTCKLRRVVVYDEKNNQTIEIITNQLEWEAATIAALYKMRWDIELFFKALKQNLQVKTFIGTSENAVKSQIYVALICFLLLQLLSRTLCKVKPAFSNFTEKIRICLNHYCSLDYVCNQVKQGAHRVRRKNKNPSAQIKLFEPIAMPDLFSG